MQSFEKVVKNKPFWRYSINERETSLTKALGKPQKKVLLLWRAIKALPPSPPPSSLIAIEILEREKKRFQKKFFFP